MLFSTRLFGRRFHLALEIKGHTALSPGEYASHERLLNSYLEHPVAIVLPVLQSHARNRMIRQGIPFIVPGSQVFLPTALIKLREHQPRPLPTKKGSKLTPTAQCLVLFHLQMEPLHGYPLQTVAEKIGYPPIMLAKAMLELASAGICNTIESGRTTTLQFLLQGRQLWEHASPLFSAPDRTQRWVQWTTPIHPALLAGFSALSLQTMLADDPLLTYALWHKSFKLNLEKKICHESPDRDTATARFEVWNYNPLTLTHGETVDPLSLYLSLKDSPDERVQQQLQTLIEGIKWSRE